MNVTILAKTSFNAWPFIIAGAVFVIVLVILGLIVIPWVRRRYVASDSDGLAGTALDIESLERSRREGLITDEEFRQLRRVALGLDMTPAKPDNSASSAPVGRDDEEREAPPAEGPGPAAGENEERPHEE
jgi:hypothetical protein